VRGDARSPLLATDALCRKKLQRSLQTAWPTVALLCLSVTQSGCWEGTTRDVLATVLAAEGVVTNSSNVHRTSAPLAPGAHVGKGEAVETTDSSQTAIALLPNLLVQLDRGARVEILRLAITKDGNETAAAMLARYADVKMRRGRMFVSQSWGEAFAKFTLVTPHGELITSSNALLCVEADEHKTRVTCISGSVGWRRREADGITRIAPGFVVELSAAEPGKVAAESDSRGQETLQEGLEVEEKLRFLISRNRYALPR
jgi:hypothetical protein